MESHDQQELGLATLQSTIAPNSGGSWLLAFSLDDDNNTKPTQLFQHWLGKATWSLAFDDVLGVAYLASTEESGDVEILTLDKKGQPLGRSVAVMSGVMRSAMCANGELALLDWKQNVHILDSRSNFKSLRVWKATQPQLEQRAVCVSPHNELLLTTLSLNTIDVSTCVCVCACMCLGVLLCVFIFVVLGHERLWSAVAHD